MTQGPPTLNSDGDVSTGHCRGLAVTWSLRLVAPGKGRFPDGSIQGQPKTLITTPTSKQRTPDCLSCTLVFTPDRDDGSRPCCQPVGLQAPLTCKELSTANMYWKTRARSLTASTPNTHEVPRMGSNTATALAVNLEQGPWHSC